MTRNLNIIQWNCRSIRNKNCWLKEKFFFHSDIICLQETFLNQTDYMYITNKVIYRNDRNADKRGGGTLIAINKIIPSTEITFNNLPTSNNEIQGVKIFFKNINLTIVNIYSPNGAFTTSWLNHVSSQISPPFIIVGDFNLKHQALGAVNNTNDSNIFIDWVLSNNINIINTKVPAHIRSGNSNSLLDLSLSSPDIYPDIKFEINSDPFESDHFPIQIIFEQNGINCISKRSYINWKEINKELDLKKDIMEINFKDIENTCSKLIQGNKKTIIVKPKSGCPWWDVRCAYLLGQKRKFLRLSKHHVCMEHWIRYKSYSASLRKYIKEKKRVYWDRICSEAGPTKYIYNILKSISHRKDLSLIHI